MITCHVKYVIDPYQIPAFEGYARLWIRLVKRMGGLHHGYFLPAEGANNIAYCCSVFRASPTMSGIEKKLKLTQSAF